MTGDLADFARRLRSLMPERWFPDDAPVLAALLNGFARGWAGLYALLQSVRRQGRALSAEGPFLDLLAGDFRGGSLSRRRGENDALLRWRLLPIFRPRVTRAAVVARLNDLGCQNVDVFEPSRPADVNAYGVGFAYGVARYGSYSCPNQTFITASRPVGQGIPNLPGYGTAGGGYGASTYGYGSLDQEAPHVTDADIYAAVSDTMPAGSIAWVALGGAVAGGSGSYVDPDAQAALRAPLGAFVLGVNVPG